MAAVNRDEKSGISQRDVEPQVFLTENTEKAVPTYDKVDYSGAHAKTDPKEIALVRKLDRWMMVSCPYLVQHLCCSRFAIAHALEHVLAQLS